MCSHVFFQIKSLRKCRSTNFTRKWLLSSVCSHEAFQVEYLHKFRLTNFLRIWLLSSVSLHMSFETIYVKKIDSHTSQKNVSLQYGISCAFSNKHFVKIKCRTTGFTGKLFHSRVSYVVFQIASWRKCRSTDFTRKWFLFTVRLPVVFKGITFRKCRSTHLIRKCFLFSVFMCVFSGWIYQKIQVHRLHKKMLYLQVVFKGGALRKSRSTDFTRK